MPSKEKAKPVQKGSPAKRVKTGIPGLDQLVEGGFVQGSANLISGACGTGKTLFGAQFLYYGAKDFNEPGVFLSLEETPEEIRNDLKDLGLDPTPLEKAGKLVFEYVNPIQFVDTGRIIEEDNVLSVIEAAVRKTGAKRVVIDSVGAFELYMEHAHSIRKKIYEIKQTLQKLGVTSIITSETHDYSTLYSRFGVEEFVCDSVIVLNYLEFEGGGSLRSLFIRKMRRTHQAGDIFPIEIMRGTGIEIKPAEERFHKYVLSKTRIKK